jgi:hypothetical protein
MQRVLVWKPDETRPLEVSRPTWEDDIKMDLKDIGQQIVEWIFICRTPCILEIINTNQQICALFTMVCYIELMLPLHVSLVKPPSSGVIICYSCHMHPNYELFHKSVKS